MRNQLVPELLLKVSDTLHIQYRYNEHVHEDVSCQKNYFGKVTTYQTLNICNILATKSKLYGMSYLSCGFQ